MKPSPSGLRACTSLSPVPLRPPPSPSTALGVRFPALRPSASLPLSGIRRAALRFHESNRPDPLLVDPYAGCFLDSAPPVDPHRSHYVLSTSFIDEKLLEAMRQDDELRQVVLFTDGMDTRPYRLPWPRSTLIYDLSPGEVFREATRRLQGVGAKLARTCMALHFPFEDSDLLQLLYQKGFSGSRPSIWILQGLPFRTMWEFEKILSLVSALAMEGCIFLGELPVQMVELAMKIERSHDIPKWMERTFMSHGFRVDVIDYEDIERKKSIGSLSCPYDSILFVARQLRLSDEQMEKWRMEFRRIEEEGDEDGFEDMIV